MNTPLRSLLAAAALVASLTSVAAAATAAPSAAPMTHGAQGSPNVGMARVAKPTPAPAPTDLSGIDRTFHPDYSHALTVDQMSAAWKAEIDRVFETPITGGG